jgi:hypothetical protein
VRFTIEFDNEARSVTHKINDVGADWRLPAERQFVEVICFQIAPQQCLGVGHLSAKRFRSSKLTSADG